jgi:hypothetical protein
VKCALMRADNRRDAYVVIERPMRRPWPRGIWMKGDPVSRKLLRFFTASEMTTPTADRLGKESVSRDIVPSFGQLGPCLCCRSDAF